MDGGDLVVVVPSLPEQVSTGLDQRIRSIIAATARLGPVTVVAPEADLGLGADAWAESRVSIRRYVPQGTDDFDRSLRNTVAELVASLDPRLMMVVRGQQAVSLREWASRTIVDLDDLESNRSMQRARTSSDPRQIARHLRDAASWRKFEIGVARRFAAVTLAGPGDASILRRWSRRRVLTLPNVVELGERPGPGSRRGSDVAFVGNGRFDANLDALRHLGSRIVPLLGTDVGIDVIGSGYPDGLVAELSPRCRFTGRVEDLHTTLAGHRVLAAPVIWGSGTNTKLLAAFAAGAAVVTTPRGASGLGVGHDREVLIESDPAGFAAAIASLLADDERRERLVASARRHVERNFGPGALDAALAAVVEHAEGASGRSAAVARA